VLKVVQYFLHTFGHFKKNLEIRKRLENI